MGVIIAGGVQAPHAVHRIEESVTRFKNVCPEEVASFWVPAIAHYVRAKEVDHLETTLHKLDALTADHSDHPEIQLRLVNATNHYGEHERWDDLEAALDDLETVAADHSDHSEIQLELAKGFFNAIADYGEHERWEELETTLDALETLAENHPDNADVQLERARGLVNATNHYGAHQHWEELQTVQSELVKHYEEHPESREPFMAGVAVAAHRYGADEEWDSAVERLERLIAAVRKENTLPRRAFKVVDDQGLETFVDHLGTRDILMELVETLPKGSKKTILSSDVLMRVEQLFQASEISQEEYEELSRRLV